MYLNIWVPPSANATSQLPVMVFIHGGNFDHMFAGALVFNGENIALKGNVIVVNMDYRIGKNIVHPYINVRENRRGNQKWTIQRN